MSLFFGLMQQGLMKLCIIVMSQIVFLYLVWDLPLELAWLFFWLLPHDLPKGPIPLCNSGNTDFESSYIPLPYEIVATILIWLPGLTPGMAYHLLTVGKNIYSHFRVRFKFLEHFEHLQVGPFVRSDAVIREEPFFDRSVLGPDLGTSRFRRILWENSYCTRLKTSG